MKCYLSTVFAVALVSSICFAQGGGPPIVEPIDTNVLNFPAVQTVDGTLTISNFPVNNELGFEAGCTSNSDHCTVDLTPLLALGDVTVNYISGLARDVGEDAKPLILDKDPIPEADVIFVPVTNFTSLDTGFDRDIAVAQALDWLLPVGADRLTFFELDSTRVNFNVQGRISLDPAIASAAPSVPEPTSTTLLTSFALLLPIRRWLRMK